jgi:ferric-chelate reductase
MFEHLTAGSPSPGTDSPKLPEWIALQQAYPQYMCFGLLALLAAVHWTRRALASIARDSAPRDVERGAPHKGAAVSWRRVPAAAAATFRILAFRLPLPLGLGDELLGAELLIIAAYMAAIWTWMFVRSTPTLSPSWGGPC